MERKPQINHETILYTNIHPRDPNARNTPVPTRIRICRPLDFLEKRVYDGLGLRGIDYRFTTREPKKIEEAMEKLVKGVAEKMELTSSKTYIGLVQYKIANYMDRQNSPSSKYADQNLLQQNFYTNPTNLHS